MAFNFDELPDSGYIRERNLLRVLPFSSPTLWGWSKAGRFPQPYKLGDRVTAWKVGDVRAWMAAQPRSNTPA